MSGIFSSKIWAVIITVLLGLIACAVLWYLVKTYIAGMVYTVNRLFGSPHRDAKKEEDTTKTANETDAASASSKNRWDDSDED